MPSKWCAVCWEEKKYTTWYCPDCMIHLCDVCVRPHMNHKKDMKPYKGKE